jgi:hypothetical protein
MMKNIALLSLLLPILSFAKEDLFDNMDEKTSVSTGIYKLSEAEKKALLQWLDNSEKKVIAEEKKKQMGFRKEESNRVEIHSAIIGEFNGWKGKNIFKLENGQIWKQAEKTSFYIPKRKNPKITIKPKSMGTWVLFVDGFGRSVRVKRIK